MPDLPDPEQIEKHVLHSLINFGAALALEIGFGDGRMARHFVGEARLTIGLDADYDELVLSRIEYLAQRQTAKVRLVQGKAEALPFPAKSFEPVILGWSL